ncbi:MAG: hypothetical protein ACHQQS_08365 [Thermoanaerobaculales bacterium]
MKKIAIWLGALLAAADIMGATVVLQGGKRIEAASYSVSGSYLVVQYAGGRRVSYPLAAVDLKATKDANGQKAQAPAVAQETGPHSPFLAARSTAKPGGPVVTDADVKHIETPTPGEAAAKEGAVEGGDDVQVVLVGYDKKKISDKEWEITARVANQGKVAASNVAATIRALDASGKALAIGSGSMAGRLEPGKEGAITARVSVDTEPVQIACQLSWQKIVPVPPASPSPGKAAAAAPAAATPKPTAVQPAWSIPKGASPNTLVANPMAPVPPGVAPQVPPPPPPKPQ